MLFRSGKEEGENRGRSFLRCPTDGIRLVGVDPDTVEDVVITHMHYDHAGNLELFPKARFHIQDSEMEFVTGRAMTHKALRHSFVLRDVQEMIAMLYGDRVVFHDGDEGLYPGIELYHVPGHTRGLQCVRVHTKRGWVVLAADAAHYYENMEAPNPFPLVYNVGDMIDGYRTMRLLAESTKHIIPGHDPLVSARYPAPFPEAEGIVVRLDVDPTE